MSKCYFIKCPSLYFCILLQSTDLVVVTLQLLMKVLVALLHLLLVTYQRSQTVQRTRVQIVSMTSHHSTQRFSLTNHLRPGLTRQGQDETSSGEDSNRLRPDLTDKS